MEVVGPAAVCGEGRRVGKGLPNPAGATQGRAGWRGRWRRVKHRGGEERIVLKDEAGKGTNKYKLARKAFRLGMEKRVPAGPRRRAELERLRRNRGQTRRAPAGLAPVCVRAAAPGWLVLGEHGPAAAAAVSPQALRRGRLGTTLSTRAQG